jgi:uncharacterized protein (TIGR00251 family)
LLDITSTFDGIILPVRASPGAKRDALAGEHAGALKVSVSAPPDKGKANEAIVELLSDTLGIAKSNITLVSGATSRQKKFRIQGIDRETLLQRLQSD